MEQQQLSALAALSNDLANAVEQAAQWTVAVKARRRFPASGIAWSSDGLIVTADHVLERDDDIVVGLPTGMDVSARIVARDPRSDIAVLRVQQSLTAADRAVEPARVGNIVLAVARPGDGPVASHGIVSAISSNVRTARGGILESLLYTDTTFFPGFSGGPLVSAKGQMLGLNTSHLGRGAPLTLPTSTVDRIVSSLIAHGRVKRGYLGITSQPVVIPMSARNQADGQERGVLVVGVEPGSPADKGGLMVGDILLSLDSTRLNDAEDLQRALFGDVVGKTVAIRVLRGGQPVTLNVVVGERGE